MFDIEEDESPHETKSLDGLGFSRSLVVEGV